MMRKLVMVAVVIALLAAALPMVALAKAGKNPIVDVYNHTGADAEIRVTDSEGKIAFYTVHKGWSQISMPVGKYEYFVSSVCGGESGTWNLNVNKELDIRCTSIGASILFGGMGDPCRYGLYLAYEHDPWQFNPEGTYFWDTSKWDAMSEKEFAAYIKRVTNDQGAQFNEQGRLWFACYSNADIVNIPVPYP